MVFALAGAFLCTREGGRTAGAPLIDNQTLNLNPKAGAHLIYNRCSSVLLSSKKPNPQQNSAMLNPKPKTKRQVLIWSKMSTGLPMEIKSAQGRCSLRQHA